MAIGCTKSKDKDAADSASGRLSGIKKELGG